VVYRTFIVFISVLFLLLGYILPIYFFMNNPKDNVHASFLISLFFICLSLAIWWYKEAKKDWVYTELTKRNTKEYSNWKQLLSLLLFFSSITINTYILFLISQKISFNFSTKGEMLSAWAALATLAVVLVTAFYLVAIHGTWTEARNLLGKLENWNEEKELENQLWKSKMASLNQVMQNDHDSMGVLAKLLHELSMTTYQIHPYVANHNQEELHRNLNKKIYYFVTAIKLLKDVRNIKKSRDYTSGIIGSLDMTLRAIDTIDRKNLDAGEYKASDPATVRENIKLLPKFYYESLYEYLLEARRIIKEDITEKELNVLDDLKRYIKTNHL